MDRSLSIRATINNALINTAFSDVITRRKIRSYTPDILPYSKALLPGDAFLSAILLALLLGLAGSLLHFLLFTGMQIGQLAFQTSLVYKSLYGALLSCIITPFALLLALKETETN
tara:strand:+ start:50548 stop:50892 length:345 start_codon:yes stop_codon:yes gene_type:complete